MSRTKTCIAAVVFTFFFAFALVLGVASNASAGGVTCCNLCQPPCTGYVSGVINLQGQCEIIGGEPATEAFHIAPVREYDSSVS